MVKLKIPKECINKGFLDSRFGRHSSEILNGIPQRSFPLEWWDYPGVTKSFSVIFIDYDNYMEEGFPWLHWCVANIPVEINSLDENCSLFINDIDSRIIQGKNSWISCLPKYNLECNRYGGPSPESFSHEYTIVILALNSFLDLKDGFYYNDFIKAINCKLLDAGVIQVKYMA
ncbi:MAG: YbhB/YbcL family Raf kinase inhibitor-like protein [Clostridia bacterium]|nr:YbhB/YbcL family Raf kinase inhibitor-like protein [Clostridia bacterium]